MYYKFGFADWIGGNAHGLGDYFAQLDAAGIPAIISSSSEAGPAFELQELARVSGVPHIFGYRDPRFDVPQYHLDPAAAVAIHRQLVHSNWPPELIKSMTWCSPINEVNADDPAVVAWLAEFGRLYALAELADPNGLKIAMFGWAAGTPKIEHWQLPEMRALLGLYQAHPDRLAIALHEYSYNHESLEDSQPHDYPWQIGRFQFLLDVAPDVQIFIKEFGWGRDGAPSDPVVAIDQLDWAQSEYGAVDNIIGAAIWGLGGGEFDPISDRIQPLIAPIRDRALALGYVPPEQPPTNGATNGEPSEIIHNVHLLPQDTTLAELGAVTKELHPTRSAFTYSHDVVEALMFHSKPEGTIFAWDPWRWNFDLESRFAWLGVNYRARTFAELGSDPTGAIEVDPLSQRDPRWAALVLGEDTGHNKTIGNWGCLLVVYNMMARALDLTSLLPNEYNQFMVDANAFSAQYIKPGALAFAHPNAVAYDGFKTRDDLTMIPLISAHLEDGTPVPARVDFVPGTGDTFEQHWVLIIGEQDGDYQIADPWTGQIGWLSAIYGIPGVDVLEALFYSLEDEPAPLPPTGSIDLLPYLIGDGAQRGPLYEVQTLNGPQQRHQNHIEADGVFYFTKGGDGPTNPSEWEQLKYASSWIWRYIDTSPGDEQFYTLRDRIDQPWSKWCPRKMSIGQIYERNPFVEFYHKQSCVVSGGGWHRSKIRLVARGPVVFFTGVSVPDAIEMHAFEGGLDERYWFAPPFGLIAWSNPRLRSAISEIHAPGARPDNARENICYAPIA